MTTTRRKERPVSARRFRAAERACAEAVLRANGLRELLDAERAERKSTAAMLSAARTEREEVRARCNELHTKACNLAGENHSLRDALRAYHARWLQTDEGRLAEKTRRLLVEASR